MAQVEVVDRSFADVTLPGGVQVTPLRWSARAPGGPDKATIELHGAPADLWQVLNWLRYGVQIRNDVGALVWWGYVHEATVTNNGVRMGLTLDGMYNRVNVLYSYTDADNAPQTDETGWYSDAGWVAIMGTKELRHSAGESSYADAWALLARLLATYRAPVATARSDDGDAVATLECRGWWHTLGWQYYSDATGRVVADTSDAEQTMGWALTSTAVGFTRKRNVGHNGNALAALRKGDVIVVTGSSSNNGTFSVDSEPDKDTTESLTATTISFDVYTSILDSDGGLGFCKASDLIYVANGGSNTGYHLLDSAEPKHLQTDQGYGGAIDGASAGASVTVTRCLSATMVEGTTFTAEYPGSSTTISLYGQRMAFRFSPDSGTWAAAEVMVKMRKVGGPTDNVQVDIYSESGGLPGSSLTSGTIAAADVSTGMAWHSIDLSAAVNVTAGTNYWVVVSRTGSTSSTAYYSIAVDEALTFSHYLRLYTGSTWVERVPLANACFQVWGKRANELTMAAMGAAAGLVARTDIQVTTGLTSRHYRDGSQTIKDELEKLLQVGTSTGGGLVGFINPNRTLIVQAEPTADAAQDYLLGAGGLMYASGKRLDAGVVPAGQWARLQEMPQADSLSALSPMFLETVEWDERKQGWSWEPRGMPDVAAVWTLRNG